MRKVVFEGWKTGMKKISFYLMLKDNSHLSLKEAKSIKDRLVNDGEIIEISFENEEIAQLIQKESTKLGVKCELRE